jgi:hypothetical protein
LRLQKRVAEGAFWKIHALQLRETFLWTGYLQFISIGKPNPKAPLPEPPPDYAEQEFNALYGAADDAEGV